jgi:hypothetical protein
MPLKLFHKIKRERILPNSFQEANFTLNQNWIRKQQQKKRIQKPVSLMNMDTKILNKIIAN